MRTDENFQRDLLRLLVWFPLRWSVNYFPVSLSFFLFKLMGDLHFLVDKKKRRTLSATITKSLHLNNGAVQHTIKQYFEFHYIDRLHIFLYPKLTTRKTIERYVVFENLKLIDETLHTGKGILLVQPHFGPIQMTLLSLALFGYSPIQIGYPTNKDLSKIGRSVAFKYRLKYEAMLPAPIVPADKYLGKVYKHLKNKGIVLTTGDGAGRGVLLGEHSVFKFLGKERTIPLGPATWSLRTGATYIPTFIVPEKYDQFRIIFDDPIKGIYDDTDKNRVYMTRKFLDITEEYIKKFPYCWHFWDEI